jgi:methylated-DNA-protein-cysteine methyltransferase-like protein
VAKAVSGAGYGQNGETHGAGLPSPQTDSTIPVMEPNFFERVYLVVKQIPRGEVASYGEIAALLGHPQAARTVGWALNALSGQQADKVPWQRVINSAGRISTSRADLSADVQRALLEEEGVVFDMRGYVDWKRFGWAGLDWREVEALWETSDE